MIKMKLEQDILLEKIHELILEKSSVATIAKKTGLSRTSIYKSLKKGAEPRYRTIIRIASALGYIIQLKEN